MRLHPDSPEAAAFVADHLADGPAPRFHTIYPTAGARIIPHTPAGHREIRRTLAMLGTLGRDIKRAEAGVRMALAIYREKQRIFARGWNGLGDGTLAFWRAHVRGRIAELRALHARLAAV